LQIIWTDKQSYFPWDNDFNEAWLRFQPLLDRNQEFKFYEPRDRCVYTTNSVLDGSPILRVYHNTNGDWQFHHEDYPDPELGKVVPIEKLVLEDPSLNEVFYLDYGEYAERADSNSKWTINKDEEE
jgi:hypothetical protein